MVLAALEPCAYTTFMPDSAWVAFDGAVYHPDSVLAAAHVLARTLDVVLEADGRGGTRARVSPPGGEAALRDEAAAQELRRRVAAANRPLREYIVTRSLLSAGSPAPVPVPQDQRELERLVVEAERRIAEKAARFAQEGDRERPRDADPGRAP